MSTVTIHLRRRDLAWSLALIVLLSTIWVARGDIANAGAPEGTGIARVYIASGVNFPDALGLGPAAALHGAPIILVPATLPLDNHTTAELTSLDPQTVIIIGGTSAVSQAIEDAIVAMLPNADVSRISATNRYKTNAAISGINFPFESWASVSAPEFTGVNPATNVVTVDSGAANSTTGTLYGSIQLPHGAKILELKAMGYDTDIDLNLTIVLYRVSASQETIATTSLSTSAGIVSFSTTTINAARATVDNENFSYQILVTGSDGNPLIRNVMVRYQLGAGA